MPLSVFKLFQPERSIGEPTTVIKQLLKLLEIKFTNANVDNFKSYPGYGTLLSLEESLNEYALSTLSTKIPADSLLEIPYPAIAHLQKGGGSYVVLTGFKNGEVHFLNADSRPSTLPISEFQAQWSGVTLLVETTENSREPGYDENRRVELFQRTTKYLGISLSSILFCLFVLIHREAIPLLSLHIIGLVISTVLFLKENGNSNKLISKICGKGNRSDCDAVITSPKSKLFGIVSFSEVGLLYFFGATMFIFIQTGSDNIDFTFQLLIGLAALPFTIVSLWLQGMVLKKWCPLCLAVLSIIWLEFFVLLSKVDSWAISINDFYLFFVSYSITLIVWLSFRQITLDSMTAKALQKALARFTRNEELFLDLLEKQPITEIGDFSNEIYDGNKDALVEITLVSSPVCGPCFAAHRTISEITDQFKESVKVRYRFLIHPNVNSTSYRFMQHLVHKLLEGDRLEVLSCINTWYEKETDLAEWKSMFPLKTDVDSNSITAVIEEHNAWCSNAKLTATPTIFINGRKLPEPFSATDLSFQIQKLIIKTRL